MPVVNAVIRVLLTVGALILVIIVPGMFSGLLEIAAGIVFGVAGVLLLIYLWYPDGEPVEQTPERSNKR